MKRISRKEYQRLADSYLVEIKQLQREIEELNHKIDLKDSKNNILLDNIDNLYYKLDNAELKNKALIDNIMSEDTKIIVYNGRVFGIEEINFNTSIGSVDTLNIKAVEKNVKVEPRQGGLIDSLNTVVRSVTDSFNKILYGNKKD